MSDIKVSVVMPVYNAEDFLNQTLKDVSEQTLKEIEIICVDDGSTDSSCEIIENWRKKDSRIQLIRQQNLFAGVARNTGMAQATGKYVIFWDSDDMFHHEALEKMYLQSEKTGADICVCGARRYDGENKQYISSDVYLNKKKLPKKEVFNKKDMPDQIFNFATNVPWNKMYLKEFIEKHDLKYQAIRQANDTYFTLMSLFLAEKITCVKDILITYRVNNTKSLTGRASDTVFCAYDSYVLTKQTMEQYPEFKLVKKSFRNRALSGFLHSLRSQQSFEAYEKLYNMLAQEGFYKFEMADCTWMDIRPVWMYTDMKNIMSMSASEFLLQKNRERFMNLEKSKSEIAKLQAEIRRLEKEKGTYKINELKRKAVKVREKFRMVVKLIKRGN